ncbi:MAG TPA: hypothetical protein VGG62_12100 [Terracidiphilus sp.]|jgi:hypothetical protein
MERTFDRTGHLSHMTIATIAIPIEEGITFIRFGQPAFGHHRHMLNAGWTSSPSMSTPRQPDCKAGSVNGGVIVHPY